MAKVTKQQGLRHTGAIGESDLKICDLCGSLNLDANSACFVCGWHGYFEKRQEVLHAAVELAVRRHGRLELEHLTDITTYQGPSRSLPSRVTGWFHRIWSWLSG